MAETIKTARESLGMTQEDLAEKCEVSRQAVSKWELGASVPSPENLALLAEVLDVTFPRETPPGPAPAPGGVPWKPIALILGGLLAAALVLALWLLLAPPADHMPSADQGARAPEVRDSPTPAITGVWFFAEDGTPLSPDLGDGWNTFSAGERVYLLVSFQQGTETEAHGAALYATPTGTETYDRREQLAVQAVYGRTFALFPLEFSEGTTLHLDITLECDGGQTVTETLNVAVVPEEAAGRVGQEDSADLTDFFEAADGAVSGAGQAHS